MERDLQTLSLSALFLVLLIPITADWGDGPITCSADYYLHSQSAMLTCHYNKDLRQKREGYTITFCTDECKKAITCNWRRNGRLFCVPTQQFSGMTCRLSDWIGDLICQLPHVRSEHSGSFSCQLVPSDERGQETCGLKVPETGTQPAQLTTTPQSAMASPSSTIETGTQPAQLTTTPQPAMASPSSTIEKSGGGDCNILQLPVWMSLVVILLTATGVAVLLYNQRESDKRKKSESPAPKNEWNQQTLDRMETIMETMLDSTPQQQDRDMGEGRNSRRVPAEDLRKDMNLIAIRRQRETSTQPLESDPMLPNRSGRRD